MGCLLLLTMPQDSHYLAPDRNDALRISAGRVLCTRVSVHLRYQYALQAT